VFLGNIQLLLAPTLNSLEGKVILIKIETELVRNNRSRIGHLGAGRANLKVIGLGSRASIPIDLPEEG